MFGGPIERPKVPQKKPRRHPEHQDCLAPNVEPSHYAHFGRAPDSNYHTKLLHHKQRSDALYSDKIQKQKLQFAKESFMEKFDKHTEFGRFGREVNARVKKKMEEYEQSIDDKRERLRKLIADDEREFYYETVDSLQKGKSLKLNDIKDKIHRLKAEREAERLKIVEEKKIQQYADRCEALRPIMAQKHLLESKVIQLQQIRENEARRQANKELDNMWYHAMLKELQARMERETQEALDKHLRKIGQRDALEMQIKGKMQAKEEAEKTKLEDRLELIKLAEEFKRLELETQSASGEKRMKAAKELQEQIKFQRKLVAERTKAEQDIENAYNSLSQALYEKEQQAIVDSSSQAYKENKMYIQYLKDLEANKKVEEAKHEQLLEQYRLAVEKKEDEAQCKILEAKQKLLKDTIEGIAEQREHKLKQVQLELKEKEVENELVRLNCETTKQLMDEHKRNQACIRQKYKEDLEKQIEYNKILKERENAEVDRMLELGRKEEEKYNKKVQEIIDGSFEYGSKHPFRRVLEQYDCKCPNSTTLKPKH